MSNLTPPNSETAERGVIGALLVDPARAYAVANEYRITERTFYTPAHAILYAAIARLHERAKAVDLFTVAQLIRDDGQLETIGGIPFIESIMDATPTSAALDDYAEIVRDKEKRRCIIDAMRAAALKAYDAEHEPLDIGSLIELEVAKINEGAKTVATIGESAENLLRQWRTPHEQRAGRPFRWPWSWLDRCTADLTDELVYIAAQPSVGKTAFAVNAVIANARRGVRVCFASLESSLTNLSKRFISHVGQVNCLQLRNGRAADELWARADEAVNFVKTLPITANDTPMNDIQLRAWARGLRGKDQCDVLIVDNMKHIQPSQRYNGEPERFKHLSERLKWLRDDMRCPVIVLHHLTDEMKMAWSRDIVRDADIILSMSTTGGNGTMRSAVDFEVTKNRDGIAGIKMGMQFVKDVQTFEEPVQQPKGYDV